MDLDDIKQKMQTTLQIIQDDIATIRVGKASPSLIEDITVPAYGGTQNLKILEMASIHADDPQSLTVTPWDKSVIGEIAKAVNTAADLGLNAVIDGDVIHIQIPAITEQRRQELIKLLGSKIEQGKVSLRQIRHDKLGETKRKAEAKEINEDEKFLIEKELQKIMDDFVEEVDEAGKKKEEELKKV